jgi:hypothetical protein
MTRLIKKGIYKIARPEVTTQTGWKWDKGKQQVTQPSVYGG